MAQDNNVTITGNVTREPELRFTPSGQAVANFGIAVNRRWQNRQTQEWEESVSFFDITAWSQLAENAAETVAKGTRVTITGRLDQRAWETENGEKRSKVEVVADDIAVSLRWATATVLQNDKPSGMGQETGATSPRPRSDGQQQSAPARQHVQPEPRYNPDEVPF